MALSAALPPTLPLHPIFQTLRWVRRPFDLLEDCERRFGEIFVVRILSFADVVIVANSDAIKDLFAAGGGEVHAGESNAVLAPLLGRSSVLVLDGAEHQRQRKLLMPAFQGERMQAYGRTMLELARANIAAWPVGERFPLHREVARVTLQVILRTVFGLEEGPRFSRFAELMERGMDGAASPILLFPAAQRDLGRFSPWGRFLRFRAEADRVLYEEIERGRGAAAGRSDILSMLCAARDEDGAPMTPQEIRDELVTMLVAGHETTATALCWVFRWLLDERLPGRDPTLLPRLRAEVAGAREGGDPAPEKVARLELLDATVREALRLKPVVPLVGRVLKQPRRILGYDLPAGTVVAPSIYLMHRRPSLYPEPARFRPERFLGFRPAPQEYLPFGGGLRRCIGAAFAIQEMKMVMAAILDGVDLALAPGYRERVTRRGVTLTPSEGLPVVLPTAGIGYDCRMTRMVALLRGINVGGKRLLPMAELRALASGLGHKDVESYIQSGNLVFSAAGRAEAVAVALEEGIAARFGFTVDVIVRTAAQWAGYAAGSPFPDAAGERPNLLHLGLSRRPPGAEAAARLRERAAQGERVEVAGDAIWIDYAAGVARSKLSPAVLDKAVGSTVTARNWNTVQKLDQMLRGAGAG